MPYKERISKFAPPVLQIDKKGDSAGHTDFLDFLDNKKLKYFSRDDYLNLKSNAINLVTETEILEKLLPQAQYNGCIIYGESGTGKTRLMLELASRAEKENWMVIKIAENLNDLTSIKKWLKPKGNHLLLFDDIEESFLCKPGLSEQLFELCPEARFKFIGNCLNTYLLRAPFMVNQEVLKVDISLDANPDENDFKNNLIGYILGDFQHIFLDDEFPCQLKPALAVFLKYIIEFRGKMVEPDFKGVQSCREGLKNRLCSIFAVHSYEELLKQKEFLYLFFLLPATGAQVKKILSNYSGYISLLRNEGWLVNRIPHPNKEEDYEIKLVHDAIAEKILIFHLEEFKDQLKSEIKNIFYFAIENYSLKSCFRLFERVSKWFSDPELQSSKKNKSLNRIFYELFSNCIKQNQEACIPLRDILIDTPLMDDDSTITLMAQNRNFFKESILKVDFGKSLAIKMKNLAGSESTVTLKSNVNTLLNLWLRNNRDFMQNKLLSSQILASFVYFFSVDSEFGENNEPIETYVREWLKKYPEDKESQLIMTAWLEAGGKHGVIEPFFKHWLGNYPLEKETSQIIKSWLDAGGKNEVIKECLTSWLNEFPEELDTHFVIKSWLETVGEKEVIKTYLDVWLKKFPLEMETSLVIQSWLTAKGDREIVREFIKPWLNKFPEVIETSFVITSWLEAGGEKQLIENYLKQWLKKFPEVMEASFVIESWLDAGGEKQIIQEYLKQWLKKFPGVTEASFVIKSWLDAGGEKEIIREYLKAWLNKYPGDFETRFVICSWLDAKGEKQLVREYFIEWLRKFPLEKGTSFVIKSWLDAKGDKHVIEKYIRPWLNKFPLEREASFVFQAWLEAGGKKHLVEDYLKPWLQKFPLEIETSFVIKSWLAAEGNGEIVKEFVTPWLEKFPLEEKDTSFVIRAWLNAYCDPNEVKPFVLKWLEKYHNNFEASYVIKAWLKNTRDADSIKTYALKWLQAFMDHPKADYVIKRFCNYEDIPDGVLDAAIHWYKKYIDTDEALYTLLYLTRHQINNKKIANQWLLDDLINRANQPISTQNEIKNLEYIIYDISKNKDFCYSAGGIELSIRWFLSEHSFHPVTLEKNSHFLQQWWYFERFSRLLLDNHIDILENIEKVKKFLHWVNKWHPRNKARIQRNLNKLTKVLPQFNYLWKIIKI